MWNSFLNCIVVRLLLAFVLEYVMRFYGLGIYGVYIACGVAVASSVPVGHWFYRSKRWMLLKGAAETVISLSAPGVLLRRAPGAFARF